MNRCPYCQSPPAPPAPTAPILANRTLDEAWECGSYRSYHMDIEQSRDCRSRDQRFIGHETPDRTFNFFARLQGQRLITPPPSQDQLNVAELIRELRAPGLLHLSRIARNALADSLERLLK